MITPSISITPKTFLERLTFDEVVDIGLSTDGPVVYFRMLFLCSERVVSTDPDLAQGMALLVHKGLLTQARHDEIMAWAQPA